MRVGILLMGSSLALAAQAPPPPEQATPQAACTQTLTASVTDGAAGEMCAAAESMRLADAAPKNSTQRTRQLDAAAEHYRKAAAMASKATTKILALNLLIQSSDAEHRNDPREVEAALRDLIALMPNDLAPLFRLAKAQEDQGEVDAAEATLLDVRRRWPDQVEPVSMLAQFYGRRVTALRGPDSSSPQPAGDPGEPENQTPPSPPPESPRQ